MKLTKKHQIAVASSPEVRAVLDRWCEEDNACRTYLGRYVSYQAIVNGLLMALLEMPPEERRRLRHRGLDLMQQLELGAKTVAEVEATGRQTPDRKVSHGKPVRAADPKAKKKAN
jgi:hypothetical protein